MEVRRVRGNSALSSLVVSPTLQYKHKRDRCGDKQKQISYNSEAVHDSMDCHVTMAYSGLVVSPSPTEICLGSIFLPDNA